MFANDFFQFKYAYAATKSATVKIASTIKNCPKFKSSGSAPSSASTPNGATRQAPRGGHTSPSTSPTATYSTSPPTSSSCSCCCSTARTLGGCGRCAMPWQQYVRSASPQASQRWDCRGFFLPTTASSATRTEPSGVPCSTPYYIWSCRASSPRASPSDCISYASPSARPAVG